MANRITQSIVESDRISLAGSVLPQLQSAQDLGKSQANLTDMVLLLKRSDAQADQLQTLLIAQQNPSSSEYHHWLTPEQYGARFGLTDADLNQIESWLQSHGFTITSVAPNRISINFSGNTEQVEAAFGTTLHRFQLENGEVHLANAEAVHIPASLDGIVLGVAGLNDFRAKAMHRNTGLVSHNKLTGAVTALDHSKLTPHSIHSALSTTAELTINRAPRYIVSPNDFATMYNLAPALKAGFDGTGQSIAIIAKSDIYDSDVDAFRKSFNLPATKLTRYIVNSNPGYVASEGEAALDVEWSGAVARNAMINLVIASDTTTTDGVILSAQYIVNHNLSPVVSVSWGACELFEGTENQLLASLWQQAAAQGMSVSVSTGDDGSAVCDVGNYYASYGLSVNAIASTPYTVGVGGTDLYASYATPKTYWAATNASDFSSALSYIPEIPWNDSCANPKTLSVLQGNGASLADNEAFCNDSTRSAYLNVVGGSGGRSTCTTSTGTSAITFACKGGYSKPSWQTGIIGMPSDGSRNLPDVSLFAGDGLWGSAYVYCESDISVTGTCDYTNSANVVYMAAGGTSFGAPAFAGVLAILAQQQGGPLGNPNPTLYSLGQAQFSDKSRAATCTSEAASTGNNCVFYDITQGGIAVPCRKGYTDCVTNVASHSYGILKGFSSNAGYDMASGLGTVNIGNLVSAWPTVKLAGNATATTFTLEKATATYGDVVNATTTVTSNAGIPDGSVAVTSDAFGQGPFTLSSGASTFQITGLPAGTHSIVAAYPGSLSFLSSKSTASTVVIAKAATALTLTSSLAAITGSSNVAITAKVATAQSLSAPTGTVTLTDSTTGATIGTGTLVANAASQGLLGSTATVVVSGTSLASGSNSIVAAYQGDPNFVASSSNAVAVTYTPAFRLTAESSSFVIPANGSASIKMTLTPAGSTLAAPVYLSCPSSLPSFLSCSFSPAVIPAGSGATTTTMTVFAAPLTSTAKQPAHMLPYGKEKLSAMLAALLLPMLAYRRRPRALAGMLTGVAFLGLVGCASSPPKSTSLALTSSATTVAYKSPVTLTATLTGQSSNAYGEIVFVDGQTEIGRVMMLNGTGSVTTSSLALGAHTIGATFTGNSGNSPATASPLNVGVTYSLNVGVQAADAQGNLVTLSLPAVVK